MKKTTKKTATEIAAEKIAVVLAHIPSYMEDKTKEIFLLSIEKHDGDCKETLLFPTIKGLPVSAAFSYGRHQKPKEHAIENAKNLLAAVFMFRSTNKPKGDMPVTHFDAKRLTDPNAGALLHGIPKAAWRVYDGGFEQLVEKFYGPNIASRLKAYSLYLCLQTSPLVGGSHEKYADLTDMTNLVKIILK